MKTKEELKKKYIVINNDNKLSKKVQEKLFALGCEWKRNGTNLIKDEIEAIFIDESYGLSYDTLKCIKVIKPDCKEIVLSEIGLTNDGNELQTKANQITMKTVKINGIEYQFTEEQLEAAKVKEKFDWENEKRKKIILTYDETQQVRCLHLWNKRARESNGGEEVDWKDGEQLKYSPVFSWKDNLIKINIKCTLNWFIGEHHLSEQSCQEAIDYFGDEFMRCLMGVK
jgi:hypothetical protein